MTGPALSPAGTAQQFSHHEQPQASPRRARDEAAQGCRHEGHMRSEGDMVDADVVDALLTMRELASNTPGNDRVLQIAAGAQGACKKEGAEDDQGTHRSDSAATGPGNGGAPGLARNSFPSQRQSLNACQGSGLGSRPNSGAVSHTLASRPNSFTGKKRKPGIKEEELFNGDGHAALSRAGDGRETSGAAAAQAAALQLQQQLTAAAAAEALSWRQGTASAGNGVGLALQGNMGRVASEPLVNDGQRLTDAVLARLGMGPLGFAPGDAAAMERLRAAMTDSTAADSSGGDPGPSAKRPHMLVRQPSAAAAAAVAAANGLPMSAEELQQLSAALHQQQLQHLTAATAAATAAGDRQPSGRQDQRLQAAAHRAGAIAVEKDPDLGTATASAAAADRSGNGSGGGGAPAGMDTSTHGSAPSTAVAAATGAARVRPRDGRRYTPPSPLGHHSDTGSDSGSPSARPPHSPDSKPYAGTTHGSEQQHPQHQHLARVGGTAAADAAATADGDSDELPPGPLRTSSIISLLHMLAIRQQQQQLQNQNQNQQQPAMAARGAATLPSRLAEFVEGGDLALSMAPERLGHGSRERERALLQIAPDQLNDPRVGLSPEQLAALAAAAAAAGVAGDIRDAGPYGNGTAAAHPSRGVGGGAAAAAATSALHRQVSYSSRDHPHIASAVGVMQVEPSASPPPPLRPFAGVAEAAQAHHSAAAAAGGRAAASAMDTDGPLPAAAGGDGLPYTGGTAAAAAGGGDERIHASLAAIERKLLLQEERLVYELKQVRLMQKLLHVQQMKQMVREVMRSKERAAAVATGIPDTRPGAGTGSPFPTAAAPPAAAAPPLAANEGVEASLARLSSLPSHLLAAAARAAAAAGGGAAAAAAGALARQLSDMEMFRTSSDAAAALHQPGGIDMPYGGHHGQYRPTQVGRLTQAMLQPRQGQAEAHDGDGETWAATGSGGGGVDLGGGRLLSYIAALSSNKAAADGAVAAGLPPRRDAGAHAPSLCIAAAAAAAGGAAANGFGVADLAAVAAAINDAAALSSLRQRMPGGGSDGGGAAALQNGSSLGGRSAPYGNGGGPAEAPPGGDFSEEVAAQLHRRLVQALSQQRQQQQQLGAQDGATQPAPSAGEGGAAQ